MINSNSNLQTSQVPCSERAACARQGPDLQLEVPVEMLYPLFKKGSIQGLIWSYREAGHHWVT
jgi:hypothetical protein